METIYNWLLKSTGNEGNYYTILNTRRGFAPRGELSGLDAPYLEIMARQSDHFRILNLLVLTGRPDELPEQARYKNPLETILFSDEGQVLDYLATGKKPETAPTDGTTALRVLVAKPAGEAGEITFPAHQ